jgi:hypothetical protein
MTPSGPNNQSFLLRIAPANQQIYEDGKNIDYQKIYSALIESQVNA